MMTYEEILSRFQVKKRGRSTSKAICPCHNDANASLEITRGDEQPVVLHCYAGCRTEDVLATVGLSMADIMKDGDPKPKPKEEAWREYVERQEGRRIGGV